MICPRCGEALASDATVCSSCGLTISPSTNERCLVCGATIDANALYCPHCGTPYSPRASEQAADAKPAAYVPPSPEEQASSPTTPYATSARAWAQGAPSVRQMPTRQPLGDEPRTIPVLSTAATSSTVPAAMPADETPTLLAHTPETQAPGADDEATWAPPLLAPSEPEYVPFAMMPAPIAASGPDAPTEHDIAPLVTPEGAPASATDEAADESGGDGLPDYETPDEEHPAIHVPKPPLPDYETPDSERTAVHIPTPPLPAYDTLDEERTVVQPSPASGHLAPIDVSQEASTNGSTNGTGLLPNSIPTYPNTYTGPNAAHLNQAETPENAAPLPPATGDPIERFFGVQPLPANRTGNNAIQRLWLRYMPPEWAVSPWVSIPVGALVALVVGLVATAIGLLFWSRALGYLLDTSSTIGTNQSLLESARFPNLLQLLLLEHGVPMALSLGSPGATGSFSAQETLPLTGLSLIPACALILAGYVAAASDFSHRLRFSVLRGALVGPVYGILLLLVALFGSSSVTLQQATAIQLQPSLGYAFLIGLVWGGLLGALGGLLAIRRHHLFTMNRQPDLVAGASWGALIALGSGLLLAAVALAAGLAAQVVGTVPSASGTGSSGVLGAIGAIVVTLALLLVVAPVGALWLFTLGTGATIDGWFSATGANAVSGRSTLGLLVAQQHPPSVAWWLLLLIPLASYLIGGRAAAHIARADSLRDGALAGWLMAVALSVLMLLLTLLTRVLISSEGTFFDRPFTASLDIGPSAGAVFWLVLLVGGVFGALGGASAVLAAEPGPRVATMAAPLLLELEPVLSVARRPWDMFDASRGQYSARTLLRVLIYMAALLAVVLLALFLVIVLLGLIFSHFMPMSAVRGFDGFFAGIAVGVPLLLLASAAILYVMRTLPPILHASTTPTPKLPRYPTAH